MHSANGCRDPTSATTSNSSSSSISFQAPIAKRKPRPASRHAGFIFVYILSNHPGGRMVEAVVAFNPIRNPLVKAMGVIMGKVFHKKGQRGAFDRVKHQCPLLRSAWINAIALTAKSRWTE
jgi:hypothetical protein